ncbi:MAG TPA: hypothetical protein VFF40_13415, partial [Acidimicrobiia bacterium]|nr:hypothetical protein [Acidimicrobiia bacterium]
CLQMFMDLSSHLPRRNGVRGLEAQRGHQGGAVGADHLDRTGQVLDGLTTEDLPRAVEMVGTDGASLVAALGFEPAYPVPAG